MLDDMLARANSVCLPAMSRSDRHVLALLFVARGDCAVVYCTVLAVRGGGSIYPATPCSSILVRRTYRNKIREEGSSSK